METSFEERVKDVATLHTSKRVIGIPMTVFVFCSALGLALASVVKIWIGLVVGAVLIFVFYEMYKGDPNAMFVIIRRISMQFRRGASGKKPRRKIKFTTR